MSKNVVDEQSTSVDVKPRVVRESPSNLMAGQKTLRSTSSIASAKRLSFCFFQVQILAFLLFCAVSKAAPTEFRGIWVDAFGPGFLNSNEVAQLVFDCHAYGFNAVLVEMRKRGDAYYTPRGPVSEPKALNADPNFDSLAEIIRQCHAASPPIQVHCWLVSHFAWSGTNKPPQSNHVVNLHPEFLTKDSIGQKRIEKGYYLDPGHPGANKWIHDIALDVASRYEVDGLHWDYCRYPSQDSGYNETALKRYKQETGASEDPDPNDARFSDWRRKQVTGFLRSVDSDLRALKPQLLISASVFANINDSRDYRMADWPAWLRDGIIDVCIPMDFTDNQKLFLERARGAFKNQGRGAVYLGYGAYKNTSENTAAQLKFGLNLGFTGAVFYDYRHPNSGQADPQTVFAAISNTFNAFVHQAGASSAEPDALANPAFPESPKQPKNYARTDGSHRASN